MKCYFCTFSLVFNMIFTLEQKELWLEREKCQAISALMVEKMYGTKILP